MLGAVGEVYGRSRYGVSWGDVACSSWSGMTRLGDPDFKVRTVQEQD